MKKLSNKDIKAKSDADLIKLCKEYGDELLGLRFDIAGTGKNEGVHARDLRRGIARLKTEIRARELANN